MVLFRVKLSKKTFAIMYFNWPAIGASILPNVGGWAGGIITGHNVKTWYKVRQAGSTLTDVREVSFRAAAGCVQVQ